MGSATQTMRNLSWGVASLHAQLFTLISSRSALHHRSALHDCSAPQKFLQLPCLRRPSSFSSSVPSPSWSAALKSCATSARYSSLLSVPSWSGSAFLYFLQAETAVQFPCIERPVLVAVEFDRRARSRRHRPALISMVPSLSVSRICMALEAAKAGLEDGAERMTSAARAK